MTYFKSLILNAILASTCLVPWNIKELVLKRAQRRKGKSVEESILDAAEKCFARFGVQKTSVGDISTAANLSRASVYRCFANRDAIIEGVMLRDAARIFKEMLLHIEPFESLEDRIVEALIFIMETIEKSERLTSILATDAALLIASSNTVYERLDLFTQPILNERHFKDLGKFRRGVTHNEIKEFLIQNVFGLLTLKTQASTGSEERRRYLRKFIVPALLK